MLPVFLLLCAASQAEEPRATPAPQEIPLDLRVNRAIALGVDYLRHEQRDDGSFPGYEGEHPGGVTAFAAYTLVKSGVRRNDAVLTRALSALAGNEFKSVYSASVHVLLCEALHDAARASEAQKSLDFLLANRKEGVWAYPWGHLCDSNTQFALLGLRAARRMGLTVPEPILTETLEALKMFRDESGGFTYAPGDRMPNASITSAALASLAVLAEAGADHARLRAALERNASMRKDAEEWLEKRFDPLHNTYTDGAWTPSNQYAYLWALERWCDLTQRAKVAGRDWYAEGATWLLEVQARDGSFGNRFTIADTCFALLFLRRATVTEDKELAEIYAELDRARAGKTERPARSGRQAERLTEWWLAGPWQRAGTEVLLLDPPFDPAEAKPGERGKFGHKDWERVTLQAERWTDLEKLTTRPGNRQIWALSTWLTVPAEGVGEGYDALLWLEVDEGWDVLLDGQRLSRERRRTPVPDEACVPLRLAPGTHLLTVLVEDQRGVSAFGALLTGANGEAPPPGLREHADPEEARAR